MTTSFFSLFCFGIKKKKMGKSTGMRMRIPDGWIKTDVGLYLLRSSGQRSIPADEWIPEWSQQTGRADAQGRRWGRKRKRSGRWVGCFAATGASG